MAVIVVLIMAVLGIALILFALMNGPGPEQKPSPVPTIQPTSKPTYGPTAIIATVAVGDDDNPPPLPPG